MKKNVILFVLATVITISCIFSIIYNSITTASGNTFSMPDDFNSGSDYHSYNIDKEKNNNMNKYNINNNHTTSDANTIQKYYDNSNSAYNANKTERETSAPVISKVPIASRAPIASKIPIISKAPSTSKTKERRNDKINKTNKIIKIEFTKHFIKLSAGRTTRISFTTTPAKTSTSKFIYKSLDNSVVKFNNKKITGIKKGFSTIIVMIPNGTVKAACSIKII